MSAHFKSERATLHSFIEVWKDQLAHARSVRDAYERAEDLHESRYNRRRFAEFSSFARARRTYLARRHQRRP